MSVGLEKIKIARKCLESVRGALEEEKLQMEKEREIMKRKFSRNLGRKENDPH